MAGQKPGTAAPIAWQEARRLDLNAQELGVSVVTLMGRAGAALAKEAATAAGKSGEILFVCGKGNNGGDGIAAAAMLRKKGRTVAVVFAEGPPASGSPAAHFLRELEPGTWTTWSGKSGPAWSSASVIVDCMLGSGLTGPLRPPYDSLVEAIHRRRAHAKVVSCDVPTGLGQSLAVHPHLTVTFHAKKIGMTPANSGRIVVAPIGIPRDANKVGLGDLAAYYPIPPRDSHKGDNGTLLLVAGAAGFVGAPYYAGMAAYRSGVDLVHACMPNDPAAIVANLGPEIMVHGVEPGPNFTSFGVPATLPFMQRATALAIGPGLGPAETTRQAVGEMLQAAAQRRLPTVVDADGLDALTPALLQAHGTRMVLTPHSREFLDLAGVEASDRTVSKYARENNVTVIWKHGGTFITDGTRSRVCERGHPTMTVGGTGDVLTGAVGALLAKGIEPFQAACAASYLVGSAGEVAASLRSWGATATDVAEAIPSVLMRM